MKRSVFSRLAWDRGGNFGIMTAVLLPVLIGSAGIALDMTNAMQVKSHLQGLADSAALAAASAMAAKNLSADQAKEEAKEILAAQLGMYVNPDDPQAAAEAAKNAKDNSNVSVSETGTATTGKTFTVTINSVYKMPLTGLSSILGFQTMNVGVSGTAQSSTQAQNALSMYLVLDRSGSMDENTNTKTRTCIFTNMCFDTYVKKLDALKVATDSLLDTIKTADPDKKYARLGAVSYNNEMQTPSDLDWGTDKVSSYVRALTATGTTNSGDAMQTAYSALASSLEATYHKNKNGQDKPSKYIILMTDGENNINGADSKTKSACASAKAAKIEVFTVAFMAPPAGQQLLSACATDTSHYYDAANAVELVAAFKAIGEKASQIGTRLTN